MKKKYTTETSFELVRNNQAETSFGLVREIKLTELRFGPVNKNECIRGEE